MRRGVRRENRALVREKKSRRVCWWGKDGDGENGDVGERGEKIMDILRRLGVRVKILWRKERKIEV